MVILVKLINILHPLDRHSFCFRYPVNKNGINNFHLNEKITVREILELFIKHKPFFILNLFLLMKKFLRSQPNQMHNHFDIKNFLLKEN